MIGAAANRKTSSRMLREFVDKTGIPFFTTQMGKGVIDETHPLWLGNAALSDGDFVHRAIEHADCIINVGHDVIEKPPFFMRRGLRKVIHVNYLGAEVDTVYFPQIEVVGDIANTIWRLCQSIDKQPHWDFSYFDTVRKHLDAHLAEGKDDARWPIYPQRLVADVRKVMPDDGILCLDNGMYKIWFARNYRCRQPNTLLLDNALATMGAGLPSAIGAKIVHPERKVVAVAGDGGFMMNSQEIETAVRLKLDLTVLLLRDNAYGMIKWKQAHMHFANFGMDMGNPDFVAYAQSYGAQGHRPSSAAEFAPMLQKCLDTPGVHLIDVPIDYSDNDRADDVCANRVRHSSPEASVSLRSSHPMNLGSFAARMAAKWGPCAAASALWKVRRMARTMRASSLSASWMCCQRTPQCASALGAQGLCGERDTGVHFSWLLLLTPGILPFAASRSASLFAPLLQRSGHAKRSNTRAETASGSCALNEKKQGAGSRLSPG